MHQSSKTTEQAPLRRGLGRAAAAILFSAVLGASGNALAAHGGGGGGHGGGGHGGGFHSGGFHGGGGHGWHGGFAHAGGFHRGYRGGGYHGGFYNGFYPGVGLGLAFGLGYPWGSGYYPPDVGSYYGYSAPYAAAQTWYYCSNPAGYYPYVSQCYTQWQPVPAS
ncbi:MAG: hypothetical protein WB611_18860 [Stellaceae bacterium]